MLLYTYSPSYNDNIWFNCMFFSCFVFYTQLCGSFLPSVRCVCDLKTLAVSIDKTVLMFGVVKSRRFCECIFNNRLLHFWDKKVEGFKKCSFANVKNHYMQFPKWKRKVIFFLLFFFCLFLMETSYSFRIKMVGVMDQFTCCGIFLHAALARNKIVSDILENLWPDRKKDTKCCCGKLIMEILLFCIDFFTQFLFIFESQYPRIQIFLKMHAFLCLYSFMSCNKVFQRSLSTTCVDVL